MRLAVIPARGGSVRIPRKNIRDFRGKPIIAYSIETALQSRLFDVVVVSTDDSEIMDIARARGVTSIRRPPELAMNHVGTQKVMQHACKTCSELFERLIEYACCLYPTAPMMTRADLVLGWSALTTGEGARYAMSVGTEPLQDAGQWYWGRGYAFVGDLPLIDVYTRMVPIPTERVCDINTEADWRRAEEMYDQWRGIIYMTPTAESAGYE